jgi:EmrB/QacA subfamily drug resistance transporter
MLQGVVRPARPGGPTAMAALMSACVVVVVAMVAAINLALPELAGSDLRPSSTELLWIVDAYILVFGCLLIPAGALADRVGRKGVLLVGLAIFTAGCLLSAAAPVTALLIAARAVTGLGAALVMPATLSLLLQVTPPARKPHAIATWSAATGAAGALGNLGGGLVLQWLPWQGLFLVMAPLAVLLAVLVGVMAPRGERHTAPLDPVGASQLTATVFFLLLAIIEGPEQGWTSRLVIGSFVASAASLVTFVRRSLRQRDPMLDPRLFRIREVRTGALGVAAVFFGLFALFFVNAQYLQYAKGYSPFATGLAILPLPVTMIVVSRRSVLLTDRFGVRRVVTAGLVSLAVGIAALSFVTASTPYLPYAISLVVVAAGMGLSVPALSTGIVTSLPPQQAGIGSGINSAVREVGAALGVAVVGTVLVSTFRRALPPALDHNGESVFRTLKAAAAIGPAAHDQAVSAFTDSLSVALRVVAAVVLLAAVVVARGTRPPAAATW